ncbi:MAG: hypothetical protein IT372_41480, partial [Polyangiaceae bacterium]|nr:hypothetical protein [Polyangiaceae bacterium]
MIVSGIPAAFLPIVVVFASTSTTALSRPSGSYCICQRIAPVLVSIVRRCLPTPLNTYASPPSSEGTTISPM